MWFAESLNITLAGKHSTQHHQTHNNGCTEWKYNTRHPQTSDNTHADTNKQNGTPSNAQTRTIRHTRTRYHHTNKNAHTDKKAHDTTPSDKQECGQEINGHDTTTQPRTDARKPDHRTRCNQTQKNDQKTHFTIYITQTRTHTRVSKHITRYTSHKQERTHG